jgi:hypothetical protein
MISSDVEPLMNALPPYLGFRTLNLQLKAASAINWTKNF